MKKSSIKQREANRSRSNCFSGHDFYRNRTALGRHRPLISMLPIAGHPGKEELRHTLEQYRRAGIDQFLIRRVRGIEPMNDEWLEICSHIIEYCAEHDFAVWLQEEFDCPGNRSGFDFFAKKLVFFRNGRTPGVMDSDSSAQEYFHAVIPIPMALDRLNPVVVNRFVKTTYEVYFQRFGSCFGTTVKGIFSDEPDFGSALDHPFSDSVLEVPYYRGCDDDYRKATGRELIVDFEQYLTECPRKDLWTDFYSVLGRRFRRIHLGQIQNWCAAHGILFSGHPAATPDPAESIRRSGNSVEALRSFSMPGIDEIASDGASETIDWNSLKQLEGVCGDRSMDVVAELSAVDPFNLTLAKIRFAVYLAALHGADHYVMAAYSRRTPSSDGCNPAGPVQSWFPYLGELNAAARKAAELAGKPSTAAIALRYPQRLYSIPPGGTTAPVVGYSELVRALLDCQWEFRVIGDREVAASNYAAVFELGLNGVREERSDNTFESLSSLLAFLKLTLTRRAVVLAENGSPAGKILLKSFDDGTVCILNPADKPRHHLSLGDEVFDLASREVAVFPRSPAVSAGILDLNAVVFSCRLVSANTRRCLFHNLETEFTIASETVIAVLPRQTADAVELFLDEEPLRATLPCSALPEEARAFYRQTEPIRLTSGRHCLRLGRAVRNLSYLPPVFLSGNFALGPDRILKPLPRAARIDEFYRNCLREYAGAVVFHTVCDLSEYEILTVEHEGMAVRMLVDGQPLGIRAWHPWRWTIPTGLRRKDAAVEIQISGSAGPLFGNSAIHIDGFPDCRGIFHPAKGKRPETRMGKEIGRVKEKCGIMNHAAVD